MSDIAFTVNNTSWHYQLVESFFKDELYSLESSDVSIGGFCVYSKLVIASVLVAMAIIFGGLVAIIAIIMWVCLILLPICLIVCYFLGFGETISPYVTPQMITISWVMITGIVLLPIVLLLDRILRSDNTELDNDLMSYPKWINEIAALIDINISNNKRDSTNKSPGLLSTYCKSVKTKVCPSIKFNYRED